MSKSKSKTGRKTSYVAVAKRAQALKDRRNLKMARSAHAYVRGNTLKFYEWLGSDKATGIPQGPAIWICGDCHVGNLGPVANAKGHIDIQIRDLDQAVIGNPAHDLIRLGLSLACAARGSDLPGVTTAKMLEEMMVGYEEAFAGMKEEIAVMEDLPQSVEVALKDALNRKWRHLAKERIENAKPTIPLGKNFWPLSRTEIAELSKFFTDEKARRLATSLRSRDDDAPVEVMDAAYWAKGCSSLGLLRYAVLLRIGGKKGELCLMDIKEAVKPAAPRHPKSRMPRDNAGRVVQGAWHLSPALGGRMLASRVQGRSVFVRELLPQDLKFEFDYLSHEEATKTARFLAKVVGHAHARQMKPDVREKWQKELSLHRTQTLDAPSWLWTSVVDLVMSHEGAYLDHCRKYASNSL